MQLFRVPLDGGPEVVIPADRSHALDYSLLSPGSWHADGRLLVSLQDSWFAKPALLDTVTGRLLPLPYDDASSYRPMAWLPDGRIMALRIGMRSTLLAIRTGAGLNPKPGIQ